MISASDNQPSALQEALALTGNLQNFNGGKARQFASFAITDQHCDAEAHISIEAGLCLGQ